MRKPRVYPKIQPARPTERSKAVLASVSALSRIGPAELLSKARRQEVTNARWALFYLLRYECGYAYGKIGRVLGKNHTSVIYALRRITPEQIDFAFRVKARLIRVCPELFRPYREQPTQEARVA